MTNFRVPIKGSAGKVTIVNTSRALGDVKTTAADAAAAAAAAARAAVAGSFSLANATTDLLQEGQFNRYFTDRRAQDAVGAILQNSANVTLAYVGGTSIIANLTPITFGGSGSLYAFTFDTYGRVVDYRTPSTDDLAEGATNLYYTDARARGVVDGSAGVPTSIPTATTYVVPADRQVLWAIPIELVGTASLEIDGALVEVS